MSKVVVIWCLPLMGENLGKKFFSIHTTTIQWQSFCLELDNVSRLSQMGEYIFELAKRCCSITPCLAGEHFDKKIQQWILEIGINNWCSLSSDNTGNTNKGRRLTVEWLIQLLDMADACHNLHNTCKKNMQFRQIQRGMLHSFLSYF